MSKATAGKPYVVVLGDTLTGIAKQAYGDGSKWRLIWRANETVLKSDDPNLIFPGEIINIPGLEIVPTENAAGQPDVTISGKELDDMTIIIDGIEVPIESGRIVRTMDTCADAWTATVLWNPDDTELYELLKPYQYKTAQAFLGGVQMIDGVLYNIKTVLSSERQLIELYGFSYTADMIDSVVKAPYEQNKVKLEDRAKELIEPMGIEVVFDADDADEIFERVTCGPEDKIFDHLSKLAVQRKVLISSTRRGQALFWRANTDSKPVGSISENLPPYQTLEVMFDGRGRFNSYTAIGQSPQKRGKKGKNKKLTAVSKDDTVPRSRFTAFSVDESTVGNIQNAADWRRSKQLSEALTMPFPVDSWYNTGEEISLWQENTLVTVNSPSCFVKDGFDFLIRSVEYSYSADGTTAVLQLIPPQAYTGEAIVEPWSN